MTASTSLILIGPMGAGKTSHGKWLARQLGRRFVDLDAYIENKTGAAITAIFDLEGESGFRQRESEALAEVLRAADAVVKAALEDDITEDTLVAYERAVEAWEKSQ